MPDQAFFPSRFLTTFFFLISVIFSLLASTLAFAPSASAAPFPAREGDCFNYSLNNMRGVWQMSNINTNCNTIHTAQTIYVGKSRSLTTLPPAGKLTNSQVAALPSIEKDLATCRQAVKQTVGNQAELSRYNFNAIYQLADDNGVDLRCDLVLYSPNGRSLQRLTTPYSVSKNLRCAKITDVGEIKYVKCGVPGSGTAGKAGYLNASQNKPYPGTETVRGMVVKKCQGYDLWGYNPTEEGWKAGARYTCYQYPR